MIHRLHHVALAACVAALFSTGCASVLVPKDSGNVTIHSEPAGATVYINGAESGSTPYILKYERALGTSISVELRKEGYKPISSTLTVRKRNGVLLADAMLLGIPYIVDHKSDRLYKISGDRLDLVMFRETKEDLRRVEVPVAAMEVALRSKELGKVNAARVAVGHKDLTDLNYPEMLTSSVLTGLKGAWMDAKSVRLGTQRGDEQVQRAKFYLRPKLKAVALDIKEKSKRASGTVEVEVEWNFMHPGKKDSTLYSVSRTEKVPVNGVILRQVVGLGLEAAAKRLLENEELNGKLLSLYGDGLEAAKGEALVLSKPTPIPFSSRKEMMGALVKAVVTLETSTGHGSGFLLTNDGYLLTNAHVVGSDATVKIRFEQGFSLNGQVLKVNRDFDVALVKAAGEDLPALAIGDDAGLMLGEELFAIGTPLDGKLGQSVTRGVLSGKREIEGRTYLQTDVSINPGNSGGPLIDEEGKVVGVATLKVSGKGVEGIGFGVPISKALEMLNITIR